MIFGLLYFCVVILCVNRSRTRFILYRIVKRHSRQSNVRRIWTCADNASNGGACNHRIGPERTGSEVITGSDIFYIDIINFICLNSNTSCHISKQTYLEPVMKVKFTRAQGPNTHVS